MQKIDFVNSQQPAINDTNLNLMQTYIETAIQGAVSGDTLPVGAIMPFGGGEVPDNYLLCDGQAVSRTTYAQLFSVIGTSFGVGDGSTTFNVPNLKGKVPVGYDSTQTEFNSLGKTGGEKTVTLTINQIPTHAHSTEPLSSYSGGNPNTHTGYGYEEIALNKSSYGHNTTSVGGGQAHNNLQPYNTTNYIIKAFQSAGIVASIENSRNTSTTNAYSCGYINDNYYSVTELYNNTSGSTGSIILSDSVSNYSYIEIFYGADGFEYSTKVRAGQSFATGVQSVFSGSYNVALYTSNWTMSGANINFSKASNKYLGDSVSSYGTNPYVKIYKVLGYK